MLRLLHPVIPFITEEIWQKLPRRPEDGQTISLSEFPRRVESWSNPQSSREMEYIQEVVTTIRTVRSERGVPPSRKIAAVIDEHDQSSRSLLEAQADYIKLVAGLDAFEFRADISPGPDTVKRALAHANLFVPLAGIVDRQAELTRLKKELAALVKEAVGLDRKLGTPSFIERAPAQLVTDTRARALEVAERQRKLNAMLTELEG